MFATRSTLAASFLRCFLDFWSDAWPALVSVADWQLFLLRLRPTCSSSWRFSWWRTVGVGAAASHVLTVINLTGINEIYMSNTFWGTLTDAECHIFSRN